MSDSRHVASPPDRSGLIRSHTRWAVEIGSLRFAVTRTRERDRDAPLAPRPAGPFTAGAFVGVGAVALLVAGATAAPRDAAQVRYVVSVPVPSAIEHRVVRPAARKATAGRVTPRSIALASGERFDADDEIHVARAMPGGAFQEWDDALGQHRFLTAGPARFEDGRYCRNMALLVRLAEGGSRVRSATRCTTQPVDEAIAEQSNSAGADDSSSEQTRK